jgi:hypothetical protein
LHQQHNAWRKRLVAAGHGTRRVCGKALQRHLGPQQRLDASAARGLVKLDRTKQVVQVGDGQRGLGIGSGSGHHFVDTVGAVNNGKLGVQAQVNKHGGILKVGAPGIGALGAQGGGLASSRRMCSTSERNSRVYNTVTTTPVAATMANGEKNQAMAANEK